MYRIDNPDAVGSLPAPSTPSTEGYFSDGDPAAPRQATIVTPDWLNQVQEELLAPVDFAGLAHSKTADNQLLLAFARILLRGLVTYAPDLGLADAYVVNPTLPLTALVAGARVRFKAAHASTGNAATLNVSTLGAAPLVRRDGSQLHPGDLVIGAMCDAEYDGANWQLMTADIAAVALNGATPMTGPLSLSQDPTLALHAVTKQYVDNVASGLHIKPKARAASTGANLTLSGTQTIDGVALNIGDFVLPKDQTAQAENGLYAVQSGAWTRIGEMDSWLEVPGAVAFVSEGTVNAASSWICTSQPGGTLGTTAITWSPFLPTGNYQAFSALLQSIASLSTLAAGNMLYTTGANTFAATAITAFGRSLVAAASAAAARTVLGLGSASVLNAGNSGAAVPQLNGGDGNTPVNFSVDVGLPTRTPSSIYSAGYRGRPGVRTDSAHAFGGSDAGLTLKHGDLSSPVEYTLDIDANNGCLKGQVIYIRNSAGAPTATIKIKCVNGVVLRWGAQTGDRTIAPNGYAELIHDADLSDEWMLRGELIT